MRYGRYNWQGYFGESFVRALASAAGLVAGKQDIDVTGVDFSIEFPGNRGTTRYPKIEVQVKSWSSPAGSAEMWHYEMTADHFNDLAGPGFQVPRYLFLVVVPADASAYADADHRELRLRHCGYWTSLVNRQPINPALRRTVTVHVPRRNRLTVHALRSLMGAVPAQRGAT